MAWLERSSGIPASEVVMLDYLYMARVITVQLLRELLENCGMSAVDISALKNHIPMDRIMYSGQELPPNSNYISRDVLTRKLGRKQ